MVGHSGSFTFHPEVWTVCMSSDPPSVSGILTSFRYKKLNLSKKMDLTSSAWIKPCFSHCFFSRFWLNQVMAKIFVVRDSCLTPLLSSKSALLPTVRWNQQTNNVGHFLQLCNAIWKRMFIFQTTFLLVQVFLFCFCIICWRVLNPFTSWVFRKKWYKKGQ